MALSSLYDNYIFFIIHTRLFSKTLIFIAHIRAASKSPWKKKKRKSSKRLLLLHEASMTGCSALAIFHWGDRARRGKSFLSWERDNQALHSCVCQCARRTSPLCCVSSMYIGWEIRARKSTACRTLMKRLSSSSSSMCCKKRFFFFFKSYYIYLNYKRCTNRLRLHACADDLWLQLLRWGAILLALQTGAERRLGT